MSGWAPQEARAAALAALERRLAEAPEHIETRFERARLLSLLGRGADAQAAYLDVLARAPGHFGALTNLGTLLYEGNYRRAARTAYEEAVARHPDEPAAHVNLANLLHEAGEPEAARAHYERALDLAPDHAPAHQGLARVLADEGDEAAASRHRRRGYAGHAILPLPYRGGAPPIVVLLLVSAEGGNVPLRHHLDDRVFRVYAVFPEFLDRAAELPRHDLIVNGIGDADCCGRALAAAGRLLARTTAPVLNAPRAVLASGRVANARRLAGLPGVTAPRTELVSRALLARPEAAALLLERGFRFPLLLRTPGFHTGRHFLRVEDAASLPAALAALPGSALLGIQYHDARGPDGNARKYRVMFVGGGLYPLHLAISADWKVHYFTAATAQHEAHRAEEARFLADMPGVLGGRAMEALGRVCGRLGLDYAGIDFALTSDGGILLFEANATMVVNRPEPGSLGAERHAAFGRIEAGLRALLLRASGIVATIS
jgi:glutathione synthase/RimK-type ligase-like ATP-grasp enzyme